MDAHLPAVNVVASHQPASDVARAGVLRRDPRPDRRRTQRDRAPPRHPRATALVRTERSPDSRTSRQRDAQSRPFAAQCVDRRPLRARSSHRIQATPCLGGGSEGWLANPASKCMASSGAAMMTARILAKRERSVETTIKNHAAFIWSVADLLRGDYKQSEYGKVILPLTVLRRLDCVLEPTKAAVLDRARDAEGQGRERRAGAVRRVRASSSTTPRRSTSDGCSTTRPTSPATSAPTSPGSQPGAREVIDKFDFDVQIARLDRGEPALPRRLASSPTSTCTPTPSRTSRWATSTRS